MGQKHSKNKSKQSKDQQTQKLTGDQNMNSQNQIRNQNNSIFNQSSRDSLKISGHVNEIQQKAQFSNDNLLKQDTNTQLKIYAQNNDYSITMRDSILKQQKQKNRSFCNSEQNNNESLEYFDCMKLKNMNELNGFSQMQTFQIESKEQKRGMLRSEETSLRQNSKDSIDQKLNINSQHDITKFVFNDKRQKLDKYISQLKNQKKRAQKVFNNKNKNLNKSFFIKDKLNESQPAINTQQIKTIRAITPQQDQLQQSNQKSRLSTMQVGSLKQLNFSKHIEQIQEPKREMVFLFPVLEKQIQNKDAQVEDKKPNDKIKKDINLENDQKIQNQKQENIIQKQGKKNESSESKSPMKQVKLFQDSKNNSQDLSLSNSFLYQKKQNYQTDQSISIYQSQSVSPTKFRYLEKSVHSKYKRKCCNLCSLDFPLQCWRRNIIDLLQIKSNYVLAEDEYENDNDETTKIDDQSSHYLLTDVNEYQNNQSQNNPKSFWKCKSKNQSKQRTISQNNSANISQDETIKKYKILEFTQNAKSWKEQLIDLINDEPGDYVDENWKKKYIEKFRNYGLGRKENNTNGDINQNMINQVGNAIKNDFENTNKLNKKSMHKRKESPSKKSLNIGQIFEDEQDMQNQQEETGQKALNLSDKFNEKLVFIKKQLENNRHPIKIIIQRFKIAFSNQYVVLLMKNKKVYLKKIDEDDKKQNIEFSTFFDIQTQEEKAKTNVEFLKNEIKSFIDCIVYQIQYFYNLEIELKDIKRDLVVNIVTNMIVKDEIYSILFRMYSEVLYDDITKFREIVQDQRILDKYLSLHSFQINIEFMFDVQYRNQFPLKNEVKDIVNFDQENIRPYGRTIEKLKEIDMIQSPMVKIEHIFKCCKEEVEKELDQFWSNHDIPTKKLAIDIDNLQSIVIYIVSRLKDFPQIITNLAIIDNFLPRAVELSNRAYYLAIMQSSCEFILEKHQLIAKLNEEESKTQHVNIPNKSISNIQRIMQKQNQLRNLKNNSSTGAGSDLMNSTGQFGSSGQKSLVFSSNINQDEIQPNKQSSEIQKIDSQILQQLNIKLQKLEIQEDKILNDLLLLE